MTKPPLILLDVDGVLNPMYRPGPEWEFHQVEGHTQSYRVVLNPNHGAQLLALAQKTGAELVWATTWEDMANVSIGPLIGLPKLPVIQVSDEDDDLDPLVNSKTPAVARYVKGHTFVWFDDALSSHDRKWLKQRRDGKKFQIMHVGSRQGLKAKHLLHAAEWLENEAGE